MLELQELSEKLNRKEAPVSCPLDQISIILFKRSPYTRSYIISIIQKIWEKGEVPKTWKKAVTVLIYKSGETDIPSNFRPITLETVPLKIFTSILRNRMYRFLNKNNYIENSIQKGFAPGMTGTFEHSAHLAQMIKQAKLKQRSIVVTFLKNAFGEVHHNIIPVVLKHHHFPEEIVNIIKSLYVQFHTTVTTSHFSTEFLPVSKGVLQGDCLSPLLFNLLFNTLTQYIKSDKFQQMGYSFSKLFAPRHWYQFADDAAVLTGQEYEN